MSASKRHFIEAYEAYSAKIYRYCLFRSNSHPQAEDLTAEVFRKLLETERQPPKDLLLPWLYRVARNQCANNQSREARRRLLGRLLGREVEPAAEDPRAPWLDADLLAAMRRLKARDREIVFLRVFEDLSFAEAAETLGMSEGAAKMSFHRSMKMLRQLVEGARADGCATPRSGGGGPTPRARVAGPGDRKASPPPLTDIRLQGENCGN